MSTLAVLRFGSLDGGAAAADLLGTMVPALASDLGTAVVVTWEPQARRPSVRHLRQAGGISDLFWGLVLGVVFFAPLLAAGVGAPPSGIGGVLHDVGMDPAFVNRIRDSVTPGTSALLLVATDELVDRLADAYAGQDVQVLTAPLRAEQERALRDVFGE